MRRFRLTIAILSSALLCGPVGAQQPGTGMPSSPPITGQAPAPQARPSQPSPSPSAPLQPLPPKPGAVTAPQGTQATAPAEPPTTDPKLAQDKLLKDLGRERDASKAKEIANRIMANWNASDSPTVDLLMQWANRSIAEKKNAAALDFLDEVTVLKPDYIEGWNRRATLHYTMGDRRKSMTDINQVLQREPRHFPALAGMATILMENGQDELALKAWERFLAIYPAERDAQENVTKLSEKLAGSRT
ncbi:hypothetical protein [Rhizobium sp. FKY42]|uniref:hypothetical protein n=1 Tax=Rhizobium sp. FKY42 TaxID=2562310 RepID=UPI0010C14E47|nr:hypothetical protein [Rhizobium sp. FKY42]